MVISLNPTSRILEDARLTLRACASLRQEDTSLFAETQTSLFTNILNSQMPLSEMALV